MVSRSVEIRNIRMNPDMIIIMNKIAEFSGVRKGCGKQIVANLLHKTSVVRRAAYEASSMERNGHSDVIV